MDKTFQKNRFLIYLLIIILLAMILWIPTTVFINIGKVADDFVLITALIFSVLLMIRAIYRKNDILIRFLKLACVLVFVGSHYILGFYRPVLDSFEIRALMELELVSGGTYMAVNSIAAFFLMGKHLRVYEFIKYENGEKNLYKRMKIWVKSMIG